MAPWSVPSDIRSCKSAGSGSRNSASANSAVNTGSRLIRSIDESSAANRRASWMRCSLALPGSSSVSILYWSVLQRSAIPACPNAPSKSAGGLGSGLIHHVSVGTPPSSPPHAVAATTMTTTADAARHLARRTRTPFWPRDRCCTMAPPHVMRTPMAALVRSCRRCCRRVADDHSPPAAALNGSSPGVDQRRGVE